MDGDAAVLPRNHFFGQQQPQVSEEACVNLKNGLYLPEFLQSLSLSLGSDQDKPLGCWSFAVQERGGKQSYRCSWTPGHRELRLNLTEDAFLCH